MSKFQGILGLNSRYLDYILESNDKEKIKFADSKLKTKQYLQARGIPVPKLHAIIDSHENLKKFNFNNLPNSTVVKPNQGSRGRGIIPIKNIKNKNFITVNEKKLNEIEIRSHVADIIDGKYSLGNIRDKAFFEQRIITYKELEALSYKGLPDIRLIVYKNTPAMGMLRIPNQDSDGKANLDAGAFGFGIDLANGKLTYMIKGKKIYKNYDKQIKIPKNFKIPEFDHILQIVCECQKHTGLGFLGCDIAIDQHTGPVLIEINARPGLSIQLANKAGLKKRLVQIDQIKTQDIYKKIQTAKSLFSKTSSSKKSKTIPKTILGPEEDIELLDYKYKLKAKIDPISCSHSIPEKLAQELNINEKKAILKVRIAEKRQTFSFSIKPNTSHLKIGIGNNQNFIYDNSKQNESKLPKSKKTKPKFEFYFKPQINYGEVDFKIHEISSNIKLLKKLTPLNLQEETHKFQKKPSYNPQFIYQDFSQFLFENLKDIRNIKTEDDPLGQIFQKKLIYLEKMLKLIACIGTDEYSKASLELYHAPSIKILEKAETQKNNHKQYSNESPLNTNDSIQYFYNFIKNSPVKDIEIKVKQDMISDVSVSKTGTIFIKKGAKFSKQRLEKLIAHEIETHIYTAIKGQDQPYWIFSDGLANYIYTQEGLAVYNQEKELGFQKPCHGAHTLINNHLVYHNSFSEGYQILINQGLSPYQALSACLKTKRGLSNTRQKGGSYKPSIYFVGAQMIIAYLAKQGNYKDLYIGKINIEDIKLIKQIQSINPPKLLPRIFYKKQI